MAQSAFWAFLGSCCCIAKPSWKSFACVLQTKPLDQNNGVASTTCYCMACARKQAEVENNYIRSATIHAHICLCKYSGELHPHLHWLTMTCLRWDKLTAEGKYIGYGFKPRTGLLELSRCFGIVRNTSFRYLGHAAIVFVFFHLKLRRGVPLADSAAALGWLGEGL